MGVRREHPMTTGTTTIWAQRPFGYLGTNSFWSVFVMGICVSKASEICSLLARRSTRGSVGQWGGPIPFVALVGRTLSASASLVPRMLRRVKRSGADSVGSLVALGLGAFEISALGWADWFTNPRLYHHNPGRAHRL